MVVVTALLGMVTPIAVRLRVEDQYWNPASFSGGRFIVTLNKTRIGEIEVANGLYTGKLENVKIDKEGGYWFEVSSADGRLRGRSNPILIERNPERRIYWGELHGHSGWEEGTGSVPRYYEFARDVAGMAGANSTEFTRDTPFPVVALIDEWVNHDGKIEKRELRRMAASAQPPEGSP